jgi:hypothetical protein
MPTPVVAAVAALGDLPDQDGLEPARLRIPQQIDRVLAIRVDLIAGVMRHRLRTRHRADHAQRIHAAGEARYPYPGMGVDPAPRRVDQRKFGGLPIAALHEVDRLAHADHVLEVGRTEKEYRVAVGRGCKTCHRPLR